MRHMGVKRGLGVKRELGVKSAINSVQNKPDRCVKYERKGLFSEILVAIAVVIDFCSLEVHNGMPIVFKRARHSQLTSYS